MKLIRVLVLGPFLLAAPRAHGASTTSPPDSPRAFVHATLWDGTGAPALRDAVVVVEGGKIACAGTAAACPLPKGISTTDLSGKFLLPGFIDSHVHFSQTGWADGRPDGIDVRATHPYEEVEADLKAHPERFFRSHLCSGTTAVLDAGGYPWTLTLSARAENDPWAPHVSAAGPLLSTLDHWLNLPAERQFIHLKDEASARAGVHYLAAAGSQAIKVWYIVDQDHTVEGATPFVLAAAEEARKRNLPLIVHATGLDEAKAALKAGAKLLVHSVWDQPVDDEFLDLARKANAIYCPTLNVVEGGLRLRAARTEKRVPTTDDPNGCVDPLTLAKIAETATLASEAKPAAPRSSGAIALARFARENLKRVRDAGIPIAVGTDAGNPLTLHGPSMYAEMEAMQAAGMTPVEVLAAGTRVASRALGRETAIGTVEKGKLADLIVCGADPTKDVANLRRLEAVVRGGVVHSMAELHAVASSGTKGP